MLYTPSSILDLRNGKKRPNPNTPTTDVCSIIFAAGSAVVGMVNDISQLEIREIDGTLLAQVCFVSVCLSLRAISRNGCHVAFMLLKARRRYYARPEQGEAELTIYDYQLGSLTSLGSQDSSDFGFFLVGHWWSAFAMTFDEAGSRLLATLPNRWFTPTYSETFGAPLITGREDQTWELVIFRLKGEETQWTLSHCFEWEHLSMQSPPIAIFCQDPKVIMVSVSARVQLWVLQEN